MKKQDLHTHTTYSDGRNTPEEMVLAAVSKGLERIGISDHSYTAIDESYCMKREDIPKYVAEIAALKEKYKGKIEVLCGVEQDYFSSEPAGMFDYRIGSVHYVRAGEIYIPVDESAEILKNAAAEFFGGDIYALIESYYKLEADVVRKTGADIIGHFDLITKFQEQTPLFDEGNPRYVSAWKSACDALFAANKPFEVNTGAISRGYRTTPYPSKEIREYILQNGGTFVFSSDSHSKDSVGK